MTKISDRFGNDIIYEYDQDNVQGTTFPAETLYYEMLDVNYQYPLYHDELEFGEKYLCVVSQDVSYQETNFRLKKVKYADNDYSINFSYATRNDLIMGYITGQRLLNSKRLTSISVNYQSSTIVKEYQLTYLSNSEYSKLLKITLTGQDSEKYNSTVFEWDNENYTYSKSNTYSFSPPDFYESRINEGYTCNEVHYPLELNADGKTDFFVKYRFAKNGTYKNNWAVFLNPGIVMSLYDVGEGTMPDNGKYYLIDKNIDGKSELYLQHPHTEYIYNEDSTMAWGYPYVKFQGYEMAGSSFSRNVDLDFTMRLWDATFDETTLVSSDFDGDGKPEFLLLKEDLTFCNSKDFSPNGCSSSNFGTSYRYLISDLNGNGKKEIVFLKGSSIEYWEYSKSNARFNKIFATSAVNKNDYFFPGDFNGDGNEDLLVFDKSANQWLILASNGVLLKTNLISPPPLNVYIPTSFEYMVVDINHDGKSDIFQAKPEWINQNASTCEMKVFISKGSSFEPVLTQTGIPLAYLRYSGEGNEDLTTDIFAAIHNPFYYSISPGVGFHQINKIFTGIGDEIDIEYRKNFSKVSAYNVIPDVLSGVPNVTSLPLLLKTVSGTIIGSASSAYEFKDPIIHISGKGLLGFGQINKTVTKNSLSAQTIESFGLVSKGNNKYELLPDTIFNKVNGNLVSGSYISYKTKNVNNKYYLVNDEIISDNSVDNIRTVNSHDNHDSFLFPAVIATKSYAENVEEASRYDSLTYTHNTNNWLIGQITGKVITRQRPGVPDYSRTYNFTYYPNGSLHEEYTEMNSAREVKASYTYDNYGNVASTTIVAEQDPNDTRPRVISTSYSANGRFPVTSTDVLENTKTYEYYPETGLLKSISDVNNFKTEYIYDGFGRLKSTIFPDANEHGLILAWTQNDPDAPEGSMYCKIEEFSGNAPHKIFYDKYGKVLRTLSYGLNGNAIYADTHYDLNDRISEVSMPFFAGNSALWTTYAYDSYNRIDEVLSPDGSITSYEYLPRQTTTAIETVSGNKCTIRKTNSMGEIVESTDNENNTVHTSYFASGLPKQIGIAGKPFSTTFTYDIYGNRTSLSDPDAGNINSVYNSLGYLVSQTDNSGNITTNTYDKAGRLLTSIQNDVTTTFVYDNQIIGQISSVSNGYNNITYDYDELGRLESQSETLMEPGGNKVFGLSFTYDDYGRVKTKTWSGGYGTIFDYNEYGSLFRIRDNNSTIWEATSQNAFGQYTAYTQGQHNTSITYNNYGELDQVITSGIRNMDYSFDRLGNLYSREDLFSNQKETFSYDGLNRLKGILYYQGGVHNGNENKYIYYDDMGNITGKTGIATQDNIIYGENGAGPHALTSIWNPNGYLPPDQQISYTSFNKVKTIADTVSSSVVRTLEITYGFDNQRRKSLYTDGTTTITKYFVGDYEEQTEGSSTSKFFFINSPTGLCGIYVIEGTNPGQLYYTFTDHLGSVTEIVNGSTGNILRQSFDAWGNTRLASDWTSQPSNQLFSNKGFTGHEHLEEFSLINMNGRVYDPMLGRFLSPDPYVQLPGLSQSFNRYSYCLNNPLVYTDPSGEFIFSAILPGIGTLIDAALWGAVINGGIYTAGVAISDGGFDNWDWGQFGKSAAVGAISGAAGAGAGMLTQSLQVYGAVPGALIEGGIQGAAGGFAGGFGNVIMEDDWGAFGSGFAQGFATGFILGGISGGIEGYQNAQSVGANPWSGKLYQNQTSYSTTSKSGIPLQPNPEEHCYGYSLEYADAGHGNKSAQYFINKAGNTSGADLYQVANKSNLPINWYEGGLKGNQWDQVGLQLRSGKEILGNSGNHAMNFTKIVTADKLRVVGGKFKRVLYSTSVWDPIKGHVSNGPLHFLRVLSLY